MKIAGIAIVVLFWCLWASGLQADIYVWEDEEGVMNFSNYSQPPKAKVFLKAPERPAAELAPSRAGELAAIEKKIVQQQEAIEERLSETNQNLVLVIEKTEALVEELEEKVAEADRRAGEAVAYARGVADGLSAATVERAAPPSTVYVERSGYYYPDSFGFGGLHGFDKRRFDRSGFHAKRFFHKTNPRIIPKSIDVDAAHRPRFRFSSTTSISPPRHNSLHNAGFGKLHFRSHFRR